MTKQEFDTLKVGDWVSNAAKDKVGNVTGWNYHITKIEYDIAFTDYSSVVNPNFIFHDMPICRETVDSCIWLRKVDGPITKAEQVEDKYTLS